MTDPIIIKTHKATWTPAEEVWTYDRILETFPDGDESLVNPLVRRCQQYERDIADLKRQLDAARTKERPR